MDICGSLNTALFSRLKGLIPRFVLRGDGFLSFGTEIFGTWLGNTGQGACSGWSLLGLSYNYSHSKASQQKGEPGCNNVVLSLIFKKIVLDRFELFWSL